MRQIQSWFECSMTNAYLDLDDFVFCPHCDSVKSLTNQSCWYVQQRIQIQLKITWEYSWIAFYFFTIKKIPNELINTAQMNSTIHFYLAVTCCFNFNFFFSFNWSGFDLIDCEMFRCIDDASIERISLKNRKIFNSTLSTIIYMIWMSVKYLVVRER